MKRSGFKPSRPPRPATQTTYTPRARALAPAAAPDLRPVVAVPKPAPCKPGKRTPTAEERAWMDAITALGCISCRLDGYPDTPGEVHHLLRAGRRIGHLHSICLCPGHHRDGTGELGMVARHPWRVRFEQAYGTEDELLAITQRLVLG